MKKDVQMREGQSVAACRQLVEDDLKRVPDEHKLFDYESKNDRSINPWKRMVVGIVSSAQSQERLTNYLTIFSDVFGDLGLDYYVILANPDIETPDGNDFFVDQDSRIFLARAKESYESLAHKISIFSSYVLNQTDYDFVIKCDDGCLLDLSQVIVKLDADYAGSLMKPTRNKIHFNKCTDAAYNAVELDFGHHFKEFVSDLDDELYKSLYNIQFAGGGYGYRLSRRALHSLDKYKPHILSLGLSYEDVLLGQILYLEGISAAPIELGRYHCIAGKVAD